MRRSAYFLAFLAFGAAIVVGGAPTSPQRPEVLAQAAPSATGFRGTRNK